MDSAVYDIDSVLFEFEEVIRWISEQVVQTPTLIGDSEGIQEVLYEAEGLLTAAVSIEDYLPSGTGGIIIEAVCFLLFNK